MAKKKNGRESKQQLGQFMTPDDLVKYVLTDNNVKFNASTKVLEPSLGTGQFVFAFIDLFIDLSDNSIDVKQIILKVLSENIYGVEYDKDIFQQFKDRFKEKYDIDIDNIDHNFVQKDFFEYESNINFDYIVGNPPFGGTFNPLIEDELDKKYGTWNNFKIKKETYSFFILKCCEILKDKGKLVFILSDTFLTINTMQGLRRFLTDTGSVKISSLKYFSEETNYGMAVLKLDKEIKQDFVTINQQDISIRDIENTENFSWGISADLLKYFNGKTLGNYILASSGMTTGNNALFIRKIKTDNTIDEIYSFNIVDKKISLEEEISKARLNKISSAKEKSILEDVAQGKTYSFLEYELKSSTETIQQPNPDYCFYNKAINASYYTAPTHSIYWKNDGEAVYTFKKNGPWYLHGVGGKSFFKKEGITWNLISTTLKARYLPTGYILDSGAPVAILRDKVRKEELWFILGWLNTTLATSILKTVINHTKNIQGKDVERMPYPEWVSESNKKECIIVIENLIDDLKSGKITEITPEISQKLEELYSFQAEIKE
jgi:adenine-specific DNA-methyltransferase